MTACYEQLWYIQGCITASEGCFWSALLGRTGLFADWLPSCKYRLRRKWKETFMLLKAKVVSHRSLNVSGTSFPLLRIFTNWITGTRWKSCIVQFMYMAWE